MRAVFFELFVAFATFICIQSKPGAENTNESHNIDKRGNEDFGIDMNSGMGSSESFQVTMEGEYSWHIVITIDNRKVDFDFSESLQFTKTVTWDYDDLKNKVLEAALFANPDKSMKYDIDVYQIGLEGNTEDEIDFPYENMLMYKNYSTKNEIIEKVFNMEARTFGKFYQLQYRGPGVTYTSGYASVYRNVTLGKVIVKCRARPILMIKYINVVQTTNIASRPKGLITETSSSNPDMNKGFGTDYVWLVPVWTDNSDEAISSIRAIVRVEPLEADNDKTLLPLGENRFVKIIHDIKDPWRLKRIGLLRNPVKKSNGDINMGDWDKCTDDVNYNIRNSDQLHLCWNLVYIK